MIHGNRFKRILKPIIPQRFLAFFHNKIKLYSSGTFGSAFSSYHNKYT